MNIFTLIPQSSTVTSMPQGHPSRWILPHEMPIGSTVYNCTFFKEINSDGSLHILTDNQHNLLYWPLHPELFCLPKKSMFLFHRRSFLTHVQSISKQFISSNMLLHSHHKFFSRFDDFHCSTTKKFDDKPLIKPGGQICHHFE